MKIKKLLLALAATPLLVSGQTFTKITTVDGNPMTMQGSVSLKKSADETPAMTIDPAAKGRVMKGWGVTFNELDWDALCMLTRDEQDRLLCGIFAPDGDLRINRGRISMGANDYARSWFSCDETPGDLELRYFNIDRDKQAIIPFVRAAQKYNPDLTFWVSPWSPPSWMKINHNYPVLSSKYNDQNPAIDYLLYSGEGGTVDENEMKLTGDRRKLFPRKLATTDYFIQDPRYLEAYANCFCKFIDAYKEQNIPIDMVMYQNEAYSYTPYPGCAWTAPSIIRFNRDYLAPALKRNHPDVKLYLGTFNTNRLNHVQEVLSDDSLRSVISGMGFQWEGREVLPIISKEHPEWAYIASESECGRGTFDWPAAEHTFELINHYLANGCNEYTFWNVILADKGESPWGWRQNALIRVDSSKREATLTPEYYAASHYSQFLPAGSEIISVQGGQTNPVQLLAGRNPEGKLVIVAGNFSDESRKASVAVGKKYLNLELAPHSFNTYIEK